MSNKVLLIVRRARSSLVLEHATSSSRHAQEENTQSVCLRLLSAVSCGWCAARVLRLLRAPSAGAVPSASRRLPLFMFFPRAARGVFTSLRALPAPFPHAARGHERQFESRPSHVCPQVRRWDLSRFRVQADQAVVSLRCCLQALTLSLQANQGLEPSCVLGLTTPREGSSERSLLAAPSAAYRLVAWWSSGALDAVTRVQIDPSVCLVELHTMVGPCSKHSGTAVPRAKLTTLCWDAM